MMGMARKIITFLVGIASLPILYLNVEVFAQRRGWDKVLADFLQDHAGWALTIGLHPVTLYVVTAICSLTLGLWLADFLKQFEMPKTSKIARFKNLYTPMYDLKEMALAEQSYWSGQYVSNGSHEALGSFHGEVMSVMLKAKEAGLAVPDLDGITNDLLVKTVLSYLSLLLPLVREGHYKEAKELSRTLCERISLTLSQLRT